MSEHPEAVFISCARAVSAKRLSINLTKHFGNVVSKLLATNAILDRRGRFATLLVRTLLPAANSKSAAMYVEISQLETIIR